VKAVTLNATKAGMTRLREKGGASPDSLYELTNGYVNASRAPQQRPGTRFIYALPAGTKGLCAHRGLFHVFSADVIASGDPRFVVVTLRHPDTDFAGEIREIHFAAPYLGNIYVVAEFDDDSIYHYYLDPPEAWVAEHAYLPTDRVQPTTPNGYYYKPATDLTPPAWAPGVKRAVDDVIQPTVSTGWKYTCIDVTGDNPRSGEIEPEWPETNGATVVEYVEAGPPPDPPGAPGNEPDPPGDGDYYNPGGSGGGAGSVGGPPRRGRILHR
jgi:hypothetical protein